jgi:hypothetical protein
MVHHALLTAVLPAARWRCGRACVCVCVLQVPEGFSQGVMSSLLAYIYRDTLPDGLDPPAVVQLLYAASYYGTPR